MGIGQAPEDIEDLSPAEIPAEVFYGLGFSCETIILKGKIM